jgi:sulfoxide reductase catalytic subunit YedY
MAKELNITMQYCIQGWSGIAEWAEMPFSKIVELVNSHPSVTTVAFYSFGEGLYGGYYYYTHPFDNCLKPQSILARETNHQALTLIYGAPLRLRVKNLFGYKMIKWVS